MARLSIEFRDGFLPSMEGFQVPLPERVQLGVDVVGQLGLEL